MVPYGRGDALPVVPPLPRCPKCGSHRTQIIGRLEDGRTMIVRCNACGSYSTLIADEITHELIERLPYDGRDLRRLAREW